MRKLFVLFLLVALVPFTVGCNGLWDFDDDDDPVAVPRATVVMTPSVQVPAALAASLRTAIDGYEVPLTIGGQTFYPVDVTTVNNVTTLSYSFEILASALGLNTTTTTSATVPATVNILGTTVSFNLTVSNVSTAAKAAVTKTITVQDNNGTIVVAVTGETATQPTGPSTPSTTGQYITSVLYGSTKVSTISTTPTTVTSLLPEFKVIMNNAVTNITAWSVRVKCVGTGAEYTLNMGTAALTAAKDTTDATGKTIKVTVLGNGANLTLENGKTYEIQRVSGTIDGTTFGEGSKRYIKVVLAQ